MDGEIKKFIAVWVAATASLCYCYLFARRLPTGFPRFLSLLPVLCIFILLPLPLSSAHLGGPTAFYLAWLANFKLLLLAAGTGPLSHPNLPLPRFLAVAALPLIPPSGDIPPSPTSIRFPLALSGSLIVAAKILALAAMIRIYDYRRHLSEAVVWGVYCCQIYVAVELTLALSSAVGWAALGLESEPQFRDPYLATSLQDFWGRRWNLTVPTLLRDAVHRPVRRICTPVAGRVGAQAAGLVAAFLVSGLMHELIYFYLTRARPTWEVTWFFVLQGACTAAEVAVKRAAGARLPGLVSGPLTVGFLAVTARWLFLPQLERSGVDLKAIEEANMVRGFAREILFGKMTIEDPK